MVWLSTNTVFVQPENLTETRGIKFEKQELLIDLYLLADFLNDPLIYATTSWKRCIN